MKRVLSLLLAFTMLVGIMPTVSLVTASAATPDTLVYNFTVAAISDESIIATDPRGIQSVQFANVTETSQLNADVSTGIWTFVARPGYYNGALYAGNVQARVDLANIPANGLVLKTNFAEAATYSASIAYAKNAVNGRVNIYFIPVSYATEKAWDMTTTAGISAAIADSANSGSSVAIAGSVDMNANSTDGNPYAGNTFDVSAGDYYILMNVEKGCTETSNSRYFNMISSLTLTKEVKVEAVESPKFVFNYHVIGNPLSGTAVSINDMANYDFDSTVSTGKWSYLTKPGITTANLMGGSISFYAPNYTPGDDNALVLKLKVDTDGTYKPVMEFAKQTYNGLLKAYLVKKDYVEEKGWSDFSTASIAALAGEGSLTDPNAKVMQLAAVDLNTNASANATNKTAELVNLTAGEYYLWLVINKGELQSSHGKERTYGEIKYLELQKQASGGNEGGEVVPPAGETEEVDVTFSFTTGGRSDVTSPGYIESPTGEWAEGYKTYPENPTNPGQMWAYLGTTAEKAAMLNKYVSIDSKYTGSGFTGANKGQFIAFKFRVPKTGKYTVSDFSALKYKNASELMNIYIIPMDENVFAEGNTATYGTVSDPDGDTYYNRVGKKSTDVATEADIVASTNICQSTAVYGSAELKNTKAIDLEKDKDYVVLFAHDYASNRAITPSSITLHGVCPIVEEDDEEEGPETETYSFSFTTGGRSDVTSDNNWLERTVGTGADAESATHTFLKNPKYTSFPESASNPSDNWAYIGTNIGFGTGRINATSLIGDYMPLATYMQASKYGAGDWVAFKIKLPYNTKYSITGGSAYKYKNATGNLEFYIAPYEGALKTTLENDATYGTATWRKAGDYYYGKRENMGTFADLGVSEDYLMGNANIYAATAVTESFAVENTKKVELEKNKEYVLILHAKGAGAPTVATLDITYEVPPPPVFTAIEADFGTVTVGKKITPNVKWIGDQGELENARGEVTCEIAENKDGVLLATEDGSIYTIKEGKAKVKVEGKLGDISKSVEVEVTVMKDDSWAGKNATYLFYGGAYTDLATLSFKPAKMDEENFKNMCTYQDYSEERPWGMVATNASRPNSGGTYFGGTGSCTDFSCRAGEWVALKVKVPAGGRYSVDMGAYGYRRGGRAMLYMVPYNSSMTFASISENIDKYMTDANLVGDADFKSAEVVDPFIKLGIGSFEADKALDYSKGYAEYLLIVKSEVGSSGDSVVMPYGIYLIGEPALAKTKTSFTDVAVATGESFSVTNIDCINSVGNKLDATGAYISTYVKEGSEDILEANADGKTFKALSEGEGYIVTRAIMDGSITYEETKITVSDELGIMNAFLYLLKTPGIGDDLVFTTRLEQNDRKIKNAGEIVELEIVESSEENVIVLSTDKKTATAKTAGEAKLRAKILARGNIYTSDEITVNVSAFDIEYPTNFMLDFRQGAYQGDTAADLSGIKEYSPYRNWIFHKWSGASTQYPTIGLASATANYAQVVFNGVKETNYLAFKVQFPVSGKYTAEVTGYSRDRAACMEMYAIPATVENENNLQSLLVKDNEYYFGTADCFRETATVGAKTSFGTYEIPSAGEYIVVFRTVKGKAAEKNGSYGDAWYPLYISFTNGSAMKSAKLETESGETTMEVDTAVNTTLKLFDGSGDELDTTENPGLVSYKSSDESIATVSQSGRITAVNDGKAEITALVSRDGNVAEAKLEITVLDNSGIDTTAGISAEYNPEIYAYATTKIKLTVKMNSGRVVTVPDEFAEFEVLSGSEFADLSADGTVTGNTVGDIVIRASIKEGWKENAETLAAKDITVTVGWDTTINPAIITMEERANAIKNAKRYDWAKSTVDAAKAKADKYLENLDAIYDLVVPEGLPRYYHIGHKYDPKKFFCRYCNCNVGAEYGSYAWVQNPLQSKWKVACPDCGRKFPSNDFGSFYELGLTEAGHWKYEKALLAHHKLFVCADGENCTHENLDIAKRGSEEWYSFYGYGVEGGYLTNTLYKELNDPRWGVDDSRGYLQKYTDDPNAMGYDPSYSADANGNAVYASGPVQHTYIAVYLHDGVWYGTGGGANSAVVRDAIKSLSLAFAYTGDAKYGRAGAILLDRVADVYPDFDWYMWHTFRGDAYRGVIVDPVWATGMATDFAESYDRLLPIYNDPYITNYLAKRNAARYEVDAEGNWKRDENGELIPVNLKDSPGALRKHVEDNILLKIFDQAKRGMVWGNFGMHQNSVTTAALALNRMPETGEMLDWIMAPGSGYNTGAERAEPISGGFVMTNLINEVDRDGNGNENALGYNRLWINNLYDIAVMLNGYELYPSVDLFKNVKFTKMFLGQISQTLGGYYGPQTGDSGAVASTGIVMEAAPTLKAFEVLGTPILAQALYMKNGESANGLYGSIYDPDPEKVQREIERVIKEYGFMDLGSNMMTGYGFAALRAGGRYNSASELTATNDHRDFAIYFGGGSGHGHPGILNLYMSAFGLNTAPDLGYPEQTGAQPNRYQWVRTTLSHNTVVVDEKEQGSVNTAGTPYHFDDSGMVKVMDMDAKVVYPDLDDYRRTLFMIDAGDDVSYGVDFFHVNGGSDHLYSFHSQSDEIKVIDGLSDVEVTPMYTDDKGNLYGTYAGADVKFGDDPGGVKTPKYPLGYTWMKNVRTFNEISDKFTVEFNVKDWNNAMTQKRDVRLKMTVLSDKDNLPEEVTFTEGYIPQTSTNKKLGSHLEYVLIRNKGSKGLDTTFTTVFEPHEAGKAYIKDIEKVSMERKLGEKPGLNDSYSAVKVTLESGRVDYIIYSTNNSVNYIVDGKISFRGFGGVMSFEGDKIIYRYLNDGEVLALEGEDREKAIPAYTGTVKSFTKDLEMENFITYTPAAGVAVDTEALAGKYVYIDNDKVQNGAYKIVSAEKNGEDIVLNIGDVSPIRSFVDVNDYDLGYVYNIAEGNTLRIPLVALEDGSPEFEPISDVSASVGGVVTIPIKASSPLDREIKIVGTALPRGMSIDANSGIITWKPSESQVGENHIAITATDGALQTTVHFTITVYGKTTGGSTGGGAGGAGGTGTTPSTPTKPETPVTPETPSAGEAGSSPEGGAKDTRFIDLGAYAWAEDAINSLADKGIIKGTSENTFAPGNKITRADFAILLVRAFEKTSDNTENFSDVNANDYFAKELAIARNTGLVGGMGDNKFAPKAFIKRCDMMLMVYRVLESDKITLVGDGVHDVPKYSDANDVPEYAKDAVSALIGAGLVNGKGDKIAPNDNTTRAEVAVLLKRVLDFVAKK